MYYHFKSTTFFLLLRYKFFSFINKGDIFINDKIAIDEISVKIFHSIKQKCVYMWRLQIQNIPPLVFCFRYFCLLITVIVIFKNVFFGPQDCGVHNDNDDEKGHSYPDRGQGQSLSPGGARSATTDIPTIIITPRLKKYDYYNINYNWTCNTSDNCCKYRITHSWMLAIFTSR